MASAKPWLEFPSIWKTQSAFMSWMRGGIRAGLWNKNPIKLEFLKEKRVRIKNPKPTGRTAEVWGQHCVLCDQDIPTTEAQVDHISGKNSLKTLDDIQDFILSIATISKDDLQIVCKPCHKIKSHAEKEGISFEQARLEKQVISLCKNTAQWQNTWLTERGCVPASNAPARRKQIKEVLENEQGS